MPLKKNSILKNMMLHYRYVFFLGVGTCMTLSDSLNGRRKGYYFDLEGYIKIGGAIKKIVNFKEHDTPLWVYFFSWVLELAFYLI